MPAPAKTRICHLTSVHFATDTRIFFRYCRSLSQNYEVSLIGIHPQKEVLDGVQIIPFHRFKNKILRVMFTWLIMLVKALKTRSRIYHFHDPELIPCALILKCFGKKIIYDVHENFAEDIFDKPWIRYKKWWYFLFNFFEKIACKYFKIILAEYSYEDRYKKLNANYSFVLNYPDHRFFEPFKQPANRNTHRIFYIGILLESRGLLEIAEAMYLLQQKGLYLYFDVVGELFSSLEREFVALPFFKEIDPYVIFHGRKPLNEGYEISRNAAVGMCIIQKMKNSEFSYPTKMFEYMHIGLPQIISNFDLYRSIVETNQCGLCVDPSKPTEIANALEILISNKTLATKMSDNALKNAPLYCWETCFEEVEKIYRLLLSKL